KYRPRPSQCFQCFRFGHIASQCHSKAVCGTCAGPHPTSECRCPNAKPCKSGKQCPHIVPRCALRGCGGKHSATAAECPVRQILFRRIEDELSASGSFFAAMQSEH
ncbi:hypothetical protein R3P38DRAFT_2578646, partial [Favolaschia claudopus]